MYLHLQANNSTKNPHSISAQMKNLDYSTDAEDHQDST